MSDKNVLHNKSCALFLLDNQGHGLEKSRVISGSLMVDHDNVYFEKSKKEGFPLPDDWAEKLFSTPPEKSALFRGCAYFIMLDWDKAADVLDLFHIESRWESWCPVEQSH